MIVKLVVEKAEGLSCGQTVDIERSETVVGRHRECQLRIPSADVSRRHCILRIEAGELTVEDLGSMNGTHVNGERVVGVRTVQDGDKLEVGPVVFGVRLYQPETHVTQIKPDTVKVTSAATVSEEAKTTSVKPEAPTEEHVAS